MVITLRVAIIGAGLSGLSCAHEFKRHGIIPTIFEKKSYIGEILDFQTILIKSFNLQIYSDPIKFLKKKYDIEIKPSFPLREVVNISPSGKRYQAKGKLGYILRRGDALDSVENQLAQALSIQINYNSDIDVKDILDNYDHIVVATAASDLAKELNIFMPTFNSYARIATIIGDFKTDSITIFWNRKYSKNGYAYLVPYSSNSARLILIVTDITHDQLDYYWEEFLMAENLPYEITEIKDVAHNLGIIDPVRISNSYLVGVAGGLIDDVFGFAALNAIISGATAATAILNNQNYDKIIQPLKDDIIKLHEIRKLINTWDNISVEKLLAIRDLPLIKQYTYNNPLFKMPQASFLAKMSNTLRARKQK